MNLNKWILIISFMVAATPVLSQFRAGSFHDIDWQVQYINALTPDSLAYKLSSPYKTELEKVRAIFSWMTQNIAYNTGIIRPSRHYKNFDDYDYPDSLEWKSANEMTAYRVLKRRIAVCEGYAKLFTTLCDHAGIRSEIITGYARCCSGQTKFRTNHSWNAVRIDSIWHLLDVTWGSGYINHREEFVQQTDNNYFLVRPEKFVHTHFPDDLRWTLLNEIPSLPEFRRSPFLQKAFVKYSFGNVSHQKGIIEASAGDTLQIKIEIRDRQRDERISQDAFFDSAILTSSPYSAFVDPVFENNMVVYTYFVPSRGVDWLHLIYNKDIVLRYRLKIKPSSVQINQEHLE